MTFYENNVTAESATTRAKVLSDYLDAVESSEDNLNAQLSLRLSKEEYRITTLDSGAIEILKCYYEGKEILYIS